MDQGNFGPSETHQSLFARPDWQHDTNDQTDPDQQKLFATAWQEAKESSVVDKALVMLSVGGFVFEQGPWNELLITNVGREAIESVAAQGSVALTAAKTAGAAAMVSLTEQVVLGTVMARNIERFPRTTGRLQEKLGSSSVLTNSRERSLIRRFGNAFTIGSASVNLEDSFTDPEFVSKRKGYRRAIGSSALVASGVAGLGGLLGAGIQYTINIGRPELADDAIDFISSPFLWTGVFVLLRLNDYRIKKAKKRCKV